MQELGCLVHHVATGRHGCRWAMREFLGRPMLWTLCRRFAGDQVRPPCFGQEANAHVCLLNSSVSGNETVAPFSE